MTVTVRSVRRKLGDDFDNATVREGLESLVASGRAITLAGNSGRASDKVYLLLDGGPLVPAG